MHVDESEEREGGDCRGQAGSRRWRFRCKWGAIPPPEQIWLTSLLLVMYTEENCRNETKEGVGSLIGYPVS